jgi:hypothetical protein
MGFLGKPYRVMYEAKRRLTGLTDITAVVLKPDNTLAGVFPMNAVGFGAFYGVYYFDFITTTSDPEGEYFVMVNSPTENNTSHLRLSLYLATDLTNITTLLNQIKAETDVIECSTKLIPALL